MVTDCPSCGAALEVPTHVSVAQCGHCRHKFRLDSPPALPRAGTMNCPHCNASLRVPIGARVVLCGSCRTRFRTNEDEQEGAPAAAEEHREPEKDGAPLSVEMPTAVEAGEPEEVAREHMEAQVRKVLRAAPGSEDGSAVRLRLTRSTQCSPEEGSECSDVEDDFALERLRKGFADLYEDLEPLAEGGMGAIYKARQKRPARTVVIKVMLGGRFACEKYRKRFEREVVAIARLEHPNIVSIYECGYVEGQPYFTMEFVDGLSIRDHIKDHELDKRQVCKLMLPVCEAVASAHQRGVIHRDLKPSNVLVDRGGRPRVLDFGLARLEEDEDMPATTESGEVMGTPSYMSPEQTLGRPDEIDVRTDVYSLGVMLYELLTGALPYTVDKTRPLASLRAVREQSPRRPSTVNKLVDADLEAIVMKCLAKRKESRYSSAAAVGEDLQRYLGGETVNARPTTTFYQVRKLVWRHRMVFVPAAVAVVVAVVLTAALVLYLARRTHLARMDAQSAIAVGEKLAAREKELMEFLGETQALRLKVDELMAQGQAGKAYQLAVLAKQYMPPDGEIDRLLSTTSGRVLELTDARIEGTRRLIADRHYARAREGMDELLASSKELNLPEAQKRVKELAAGFDDACWASCLKEMDDGRPPIKVLVNFLSQCGENVHRADAANRLDSLTESICYAQWPFTAQEAQSRQSASAQLLGVPTQSKITLDEQLTLPLTLVPAGEYVMGSSEERHPDTENEKPARRVRLSRPFYLGTTEVTMAQFAKVMGVPFKPEEADLPVSGVSWETAVEFCRRLSMRTGLQVRLPTEAEWEYACRAGAPGLFAHGDEADEAVLAQYAWYGRNSENAVRPVRAKAPNPFGIYDMCGNVLEWCQDWYDTQNGAARSLMEDPGGPARGQFKVLRGGSYGSTLAELRPSYRVSNQPDTGSPVDGLRVCVDILPREEDISSANAVSLLILE